MGKLVWDQTGEKFYETGVQDGVLYPYNNNAYQTGVAWNGLTSVSQSPEGAEATKLWADNREYLNLLSNETFKATIEAYMYPDEFKACNGEKSIATGVTIGQQSRMPFGFCYKTKVGSDADPEAGYKIHIVYGCQAAPSEKSYATVNDSPEAMTLSWEINTTPVNVSGSKPTAYLEIDSRDFNTVTLKAKLTEIEDILYGKDASGNDEATDPRLPLPDEIAQKIGVVSG